MKVFMLGWEFPPHISGGLGTACFGMTRGLDEVGVDVSFVLPTAIPVGTESHVTIRSPSNLPGGGATWIDEVRRVFQHVQLHQVPAVLMPYGNQDAYRQALKKLIA